MYSLPLSMCCDTPGIPLTGQIRLANRLELGSMVCAVFPHSMFWIVLLDSLVTESALFRSSMHSKRITLDIPSSGRAVGPFHRM